MKGTEMVWAVSPPPEVDDRYPLRDLVWCGLCDVPMRPVPLSTNRRLYDCVSPGCPRPVVPADLLEVLVWQAVLYLFAEPTVELTEAEQRQALNHALERVTVGVDLGDVRYSWRDMP
jgi:hypothetical protein